MISTVKERLDPVFNDQGFGQEESGHLLDYPRVLTVSQLTLLIKELLETSFHRLWVEGEISNFSSPFSGHYYFVLKDEQAQVRCVMFRNQARALRFIPENGMKVLVEGEINVYMPRGEYQIIVNYIEPLGVGAMALAFEQLKRKLAGLGLFDKEKKRPIPYLPQKVAVITSPSGAAIRDFLKVIKRRFADIEIKIIPVRVQGEEASQDIINALRFVNAHLNVDVIVITRGGGSLEDLWPFNSEDLAYAIRESRIPVVSAVGHEIDWTICDFAADLRAPTPSAAAELLVKEKAQLEQRAMDLKKRLVSSFKRQMDRESQRLEFARSRLKAYKKDVLILWETLDERFNSLRLNMFHLLQGKASALKTTARELNLLGPQKIIMFQKDRLERLRGVLVNSTIDRIKDLKNRVILLAASLNNISPMNVLKRGYSITTTMDGKLVRNTLDVEVNEKIRTILTSGKIISSILSIEN